jgi:hypothetical protein
VSISSVILQHGCSEFGTTSKFNRLMNMKSQPKIKFVLRPKQEQL